MSVANKQFDQALREARRAEAAHHDALQNVSDAKSLRLIDLQERLSAALPTTSDIQALLELRLEPGENPRLFIDLITSVAITEDAHTFRLTQDRDYRRETLLETGSVDEMCRHVLKYVAHRLIAKERKDLARDSSPAPLRASEPSWPDLILGWMIAAAVGATAFAAITKSLGKLNF